MQSYTAPPAIQALWPTPPLGDWAVRDMQKTIPLAGGDGFAQPQKNELNDLDNGSSSPDATDYGVGEPINNTTSPARVNYRAERGVGDQGAYVELHYNKILNHVVTHSLGRESLYNWADAQFNVGGVGYPRDYGFGPGFHGDCTVEMGNVQFYMRPGIYRGATPEPQVPPSQLYPNLSPGIRNQLNTPVRHVTNAISGV